MIQNMKLQVLPQDKFVNKQSIQQGAVSAETNEKMWYTLQYTPNIDNSPSYAT
jgi:hypothetical protein